MVRSMVVLVAVVVALVLGGRAMFGDPSTPQRTVDYQQTAKKVRKIAPFKIAAPDRLPDGWRATTATYDRGPKGRWHLGVLTADDDYVGLEQTPLSRRTSVERFAPKTKPRGWDTIAGSRWRVRASSEGETTFVRRANGLTTVVTGTASRDQLEAYVASLRSR